MRFSLITIAFVASNVVFAAPVRRQGAGVGAGCDSIVSDADTMLGESVRGQGANLANTISGSGARSLWERQGAGVGAGCNSIVSDADTMLGESVRGQGKGVANDINGTSRKRQLNGIADGVTDVTGTLPGASGESQSLDSQLNTLDGDGTQGSANLGKAIGDEELNIGSTVGGSNGQNGGGGGSSPPPPPPPPHRRQLNGIADGVTDVTGTVPGQGDLSSNLDSYLNTVDGQGTGDSAQAGQIVGDEELNLGKQIGGTNGQNGGSGGSSGGSPPPPPPPPPPHK